MTIAAAPHHRFGDQLRQWRRRRRMSQLDFALEAEISQKHLSFVETGRAAPSRDMVIRLAECLEVPLRERNAMLVAAGYAPHYPARGLDDPGLAPARAAIDLLLAGHEPFPALAVDRHWTMLAANRAVAPLMTGIADAALAEPPVNVLELSLSPDGLAPRIVNFGAWRRHVLERLRHQIAATADPVLVALKGRLEAFPYPADSLDSVASEADLGGVLVPLVLSTPAGTLSFFSTTTVFGTPLDVTLSEVAIESFFPADDATRQALAAMAAREG